MEIAMRTLTQPPPSLHCELCGGELRLKLIDLADRQFDLEKQVWACAKCGHEQSYTAARDRYMPDSKAA
jgi:rRNA maturation endonuclease Nob1